MVVDPTSPRTVYATCGGRVHRSTNAGEGWALANAGLPPSGTYALAVNPQSPSTLYAGTEAGVFRTSNSGGIWTAACGQAPCPGVVLSLAIDPTTPSRVYAGTGSGVFRSTDGGETWVGAGLSGQPVRALALDPTTPSTLYAVGLDIYDVLLKSTNSGESWSASSDGLPGIVEISSLVIDPATPSTLYAVTSSGLFKSTTAGESWTHLEVYPGSWVFALAVDPTTPAILYAATPAGVFRSTDSGGTWTVSNAGLAAHTGSALAVAPSMPSTLYLVAGVYGDPSASVLFFRSLDSGGTWVTPASGTRSVSVRSLAIDPLVPGTLYASDGNPPGSDRSFSARVFKSTTWGDTWATASAGLPDNEPILSLAIDPATPSTLYAGGSTQGVYKSTDSGNSWTQTGLTGRSVGALAIDPATPSTLYAGVELVASDGGSVLKSTDAGNTWAALTLTAGWYISSLVIDPLTPSTLYASGDGDGVFKSTDSGGTWGVASSGLPFTIDKLVYDLVIDPAVPSTLYAATFFGGVYKSTNSAGSWFPANTGLPDRATISALAIDSATPSTVYASTPDRLFISTNSGGTWSALGVGLPSGRGAPMQAVAVDPRGSKTVYVASSGVWQLSARVLTEFYVVAPCRVYDSRQENSGGTGLYAASTRTVPVGGHCGVPATAKAVAINVTVTAPSSPGYLTLYAENSFLPAASTLNYSAGQTRATSAVTALGLSGALKVYVGQQWGDVQVIIDVSGYYQ